MSNRVRPQISIELIKLAWNGTTVESSSNSTLARMP